MTTQGISIAGRKIKFENSSSDFYQTPTWATEKLLEKEKFEGTILEPASGAGAISKVLESHEYLVVSQDIREDENVYGSSGIDFFTEVATYENIITNPPYKYAQEFIEHSLRLAKKKVAMILRLTFLESVKRYEFFQSTPLKKVYVFCKRVNMCNNPRGSSTVAYAWYVWEKEYEGKPQIDWLI